jgi:hypothetical protein
MPDAEEIVTAGAGRKTMSDYSDAPTSFFSGVERICVSVFEDNAPPWRSDQLWQAADRTLQYLICRHHHQLDQARNTAGCIKTLIVSIDDALNILGSEICAQCLAPCCKVADVSYDFKDLVFIHMAEQAMPKGQPRRMAGEICRYLGPEGCLIPRIQRPWICTWYICAAQKNYMDGHHEISRSHLLSVIAQISTLRKQMESVFIDTVAPT